VNLIKAADHRRGGKTVFRDATEKGRRLFRRTPGKKDTSVREKPHRSKKTAGGCRNQKKGKANGI